MEAAHYVPRKPLSEFVGLFWYARGHTMSGSAERILPTGTVDLVINLGSGRPIDSGISGPQSQSFLIHGAAQGELLGVHFHPGGAFPFLGHPCGALHNLRLTLADIWSDGKAGELLALLHDAPSVECKFQVLEKWLLRSASRPLRHHPAAAFALIEFQRDPGASRSAAMADKVGYSQRRFIEVFHDEVGLTPKLFCRVRRFHEVIKTIARRDAVDWAEIALACGYFDQAHFVHEFHELSGLTPREYLRLRTEHLRHVRVHE